MDRRRRGSVAVSPTASLWSTLVKLATGPDLSAASMETAPSTPRPWGHSLSGLCGSPGLPINEERGVVQAFQSLRMGGVVQACQSLKVGVGGPSLSITQERGVAQAWPVRGPPSPC